MALTGTVLVWGAASLAETPDPAAVSGPGVGVAPAAAPPDAAVSETAQALFDAVTAQAEARARADYQPPGGALPATLRELNYDQYRAIRFRPEAALWRDQARFEVQFFHPGFLFPHPVSLHQVETTGNQPIAFDPMLFRYEAEAQGLDADLPEDLGFAGFRLHYPLHGPAYKDEVLVFLGASYFRLVGPGQVYGLSSRGLAIDTARPGGEEFPVFRRFWLLRPAPETDTMTILALLDGPSVSGAYRFDLRVAETVTMDVEARLFAREDVEMLGIAPLTSMFLFGPDSAGGYDDFRPRVHDSEGLMQHTAAGEWIWRPLSNPRQLRVSSLRDRPSRGFGLVQRHRDFAGYLDLEAQYHRRPSQWVTPLEGDWGTGGVELVEIPTDSETEDNIVAYWVGEAPFRAGDDRRYRYRLTLFDDQPPGDPPARVVRSRSGWGAVPGVVPPPPRSLRRYVIDFAGGALAALEADASLQPRLQASAGRIEDLGVRPLPESAGWRASFLLDPEGAPVVDLRLALTRDGQPLTETWNHVWYPDEG